MAKKKKPAANPARGFATTSIASKPKPEKETPPEAVVATSTEETAVPSSALPDTPAITVTQNERELHELSPDELEQRLEESELQLTVEKHGAKSQRDALRHVSKFQTDCRLLRGQSQSLATRQLVPEKTLLRALELAAEDIAATGPVADEHQARRLLQEEDIIVRLWTLQKALLLLGFPETHVDDVLKHILRYPPADSNATIWGLDESLDWLVLSISEDDLPDYDSQTGKVKGFVRPEPALGKPLMS